MYDNNNIEVNINTKEFPFEYKWLEFRLIINKELYDEKVIDLKTFKLMEECILHKLSRISANKVHIDNPS